MPNVIYWLHTLTPTHAGVGRGVGYIDLPIDRDAVTNWPIIRGSAFKGVWADYYKATEKARKDDPKLKAAFGMSSDAADNASNSGSLIPTDAKIVCLPIRSFRGTFAWCTSSLVLQMLRRTLEIAGIADLPAVPEPSNDESCLLSKGTALREGQKVYLEDLDFQATENADAGLWAEKIGGFVFHGKANWLNEFKKRFCILPDVVFDFLCETGTEVQTRVRIKDDTKTVERGALWTEESLPAETILAGMIACDRVFGPNGHEVKAENLIGEYATKELKNLQIGGKATVGRGQVRCVFTQGGTK